MEASDRFFRLGACPAPSPKSIEKGLNSSECYGYSSILSITLHVCTLLYFPQ